MESECSAPEAVTRTESRIRQSLKPLSSWLRSKSKGGGGGRRAKGGDQPLGASCANGSANADPSSTSSSSVQRRDLPPLPPPSSAAAEEGGEAGQASSTENGCHPPAVVDICGVSMDELLETSPNLAFIPEDDSDEEGRTAATEGKSPSGVEIAKSLEAVKNCCWYWGPISGEVAERLLSAEPNGSFLVRDSSDDHYIFSLSFKLNDKVRHVRIEHDQGNFSFGTYTRFKSSTIVDFIENAVSHSRSGRYLFFLHRQPTLGPLQVQLLHPVSRFKTVHSLQHQCRFVILQYVPRDMLHKLQLPQKIQDYLNTPHYYSEQAELLT